MDRLKFLSLLAVLALLGCRENRVSVAGGELLVQPVSVDFGQTFRGHRGTAALELQNTGRSGLDVTLELGTPFDAPALVHVGGGERLTVELGVTADSLGVARRDVAGERGRQHPVGAAARGGLRSTGVS